MKKTYIVIAAYNEEKMLKKTLQDVKKYCNNIVVVDDGSKDKTFEIAQKCGVEAIKHIVNRGQGAALKTGIDYALQNNADVVVTFDADGQMDAREIKKVAMPVLLDEADAVFGSRFLGESNIKFLRKILLKCGIIFTRLLSGIKLTDTHNGFRALSNKALNLMEIKQDKMAHSSEIINEIAKHKLKYKEVPVTINYTQYSLQKGQKISGAFNIVLDLFWGRYK